jgi:hypothetical protein
MHFYLISCEDEVKNVYNKDTLWVTFVQSCTKTDCDYDGDATCGKNTSSYGNKYIFTGGYFLVGCVGILNTVAAEQCRPIICQKALDCLNIFNDAYSCQNDICTKTNNNKSLTNLDVLALCLSKTPRKESDACLQTKLPWTRPMNR